MLAASGGESGLVAPKTEATHAAQRKAIGSALSIGTTLWWLSVERGLRGWRFEGMEAREDGVWRVTGGGEGGRQSRQTVALLATTDQFFYVFSGSRYYFPFIP